jgi:hypothetical protein
VGPQRCSVGLFGDGHGPTHDEAYNFSVRVGELTKITYPISPERHQRPLITTPNPNAFSPTATNKLTMGFPAKYLGL